MSAAGYVDPEYGDDLTAIVDAVGARNMPAAELGAIIDPSMRPHLTDLALELTLREWTVDHDVCQGSCGRTVCHCPGPECCGGCVDQGPCDHAGMRLCDDCRLACPDCRDNLADEYIDGDER